MSHPINPAYLAEGKKIADRLMEAAFGRSTPSPTAGPIGEIRQAAQVIREQMANRCRCWMDNQFNPTVAGHIADLLDKEAGLGNTGHALLLARAINATAPSTSEETP